MYVPESVTFNTLWPHLRFQLSSEGRTNVARDETRVDYAQMFVRAMKAYLKGVGHPQHPSLADATGLTAAQIDTQRNDADLRPRLLLLAVLNKHRPPYDAPWKIMVSIPPARHPSHADVSLAQFNLFDARMGREDYEVSPACLVYNPWWVPTLTPLFSSPWRYKRVSSWSMSRSVVPWKRSSS